MKRNLPAMLLAAFVLVGVGCHAASNPWAGKTYQEPSSRSNPPQSTYAPMPSILPSLKSNSAADESTDAPVIEASEPSG